MKTLKVWMLQEKLPTGKDASLHDLYITFAPSKELAEHRAATYLGYRSFAKCVADGWLFTKAKQISVPKPVADVLYDYAIKQQR